MQFNRKYNVGDQVIYEPWSPQVRERLNCKIVGKGIARDGRTIYRLERTLENCKYVYVYYAYAWELKPVQHLRTNAVSCRNAFEHAGFAEPTENTNA